MVTWRELITHELKRYPSETIVDVAPNESVLDVEFDNDFGATEGEPFTVWTQNRVLFPVRYDGAEWAASVSRNPDGEATEHVGGGG